LKTGVERENLWREALLIGPVLGLIAIATSLGGPLMGRVSDVAAVAMAFANLGVFLIGFPLAGVLVGRLFAKRESERTGYSVTATDGGFAATRMALVAAGLFCIATLLSAALISERMMSSRVSMPCFDPRSVLGGGIGGLVCTFLCMSVIGGALAWAGGALGARLSQPPSEPSPD
jgi:hypothetical protein